MSALDSPLFLVHEDRLEKLETTAMDTAKSIAEIQTTIKHFEDKVETQLGHIGVQIEKLALSIEKQAETVKVVSTRVDQIEMDKRAAAKVRNTWVEVGLKVLVYILTAAAGAGGTWLVGHFGG